MFFAQSQTALVVDLLPIILLRTLDVSASIYRTELEEKREREMQYIHSILR